MSGPNAMQLWKRCAWLKKHALEDGAQARRDVNRSFMVLAQYLGWAALMFGCAVAIAAVGYSTMLSRGDWYPMAGFTVAMWMFWPRALWRDFMSGAWRRVQADQGFIERCEQRDQAWKARDEAIAIGHEVQQPQACARKARRL